MVLKEQPSELIEKEDKEEKGRTLIRSSSGRISSHIWKSDTFRTIDLGQIRSKVRYDIAVYLCQSIEYKVALPI